MVEKCEMCGATENIQRHHISYEPEIIQLLCVDCHKRVHGHGVGTVGKNGISLVNEHKEEFTMLCEAEATNREIAKFLGINKLTVGRWKKILGFKGKGKRFLKTKEEKAKSLGLSLSASTIAKLDEIAQDNNKELADNGKEPTIKASTVAARIVKAYFGKEAE